MFPGTHHTHHGIGKDHTHRNFGVMLSVCDWLFETLQMPMVALTETFF